MAEIYVQSSNAIQGVIDQLTSLNNEYRSKAADIRTEHTTLVTKWEGDASTAFEDHFKQEEPNFESFATAIDEYIRALQEILAEYEQAEATNKAIASQ